MFERLLRQTAVFLVKHGDTRDCDRIRYETILFFARSLFLFALLSYSHSFPVDLVIAFCIQREQALMLKVVRIFVVGVLSVSARHKKPMSAPDGIESFPGKVEEKGQGPGDAVVSLVDDKAIKAAAAADTNQILGGLVLTPETPAGDVLLPLSSSLVGNAGDVSAVGNDGKDNVDSVPCDSTEEMKTAPSLLSVVAVQGHTPDGGDGLGGGGGPSLTPVGSEVGKPATLWARLPQDVTAAVLRAVNVPELQVEFCRPSFVSFAEAFSGQLMYAVEDVEYVRTSCVPYSSSEVRLHHWESANLREDLFVLGLCDDRLFGLRSYRKRCGRSFARHFELFSCVASPCTVLVCALLQFLRCPVSRCHCHRCIKARLMELVGVAADIADASACSRTAAGGRLSGVARLPDARDIVSGNMVHTSTPNTPLDLFGCVGEGAPAEAMAEEALRLWVGVARAPPGSREAVLPWREGVEERDVCGNSEVRERLSGAGPAMDEATAVDMPVLKAIFCTSDAIRLQLEQSLLLVCGGSGGGSDGGSGAARDDVRTASGNTQQQEGQCGDDSLGTVASPHPGVTTMDETSVRTAADGVREHVVRLLLDNIPREDKIQEGGGMVVTTVDGEEVEKRRALAGAARRRQQESRRRDCTQLFHVLCHLVGESMRASAGKHRAREEVGSAVDGSDVGGFDVDSLTCNVKERLLAHPCTERRGAKEADRDTLLVSA